MQKLFDEIHHAYLEMTSFFITSATPDNQGGIWFSTWLWGAIYFDGETYEYLSLQGPQVGNPQYWDDILDIGIDQNGTVWFATVDGIASYDGLQITKYSGSPTEALAIAIASDNTVWVGTKRDGIAHFTGRDH